ncbi:MAG: DUF1501 domain-containing protein [Phaeodactylibacter sp.]|nr:DUF1501 domain-containing protein [Phaeodactylibacter sp.]
MNRRNFIQQSAALGMYPLLAGALPLRGLASSTPFLPNPCEVTDRSVVIIFLNGANDIFNTAVPLSQFSAYTQFRPSVHLPEQSLLTLDANLSDEQALGLHPRLAEFKNLYDDGLLTLIQGVGYDQPNRSHFKSTENWLPGSGGALQNRKDGWMARFLQDRYPGYNGTPFDGEPDPLALLFGNTISTGFHSAEEHRLEINLSGQDPAGFYTLISSLSGAPIPQIPDTDHGSILNHIQTISNSVNVYASRISDVFNNGTNATDYPNSSLGNQLKTIARMLSGGSRTKIFMASKGGWDNHNYMNQSGNTTEGTHANLLGDLSTSVSAFQEDLQSLGLDNNVLTVIFSEFGRKIIQNGSQGTDHGTLSSMFMVGKGVEGGVIGNNINLSDQDNPGAPNPAQIQYDYRQVFSTVLQDWLGADDNALQNTFTNSAYINNRPSFINPGNLVPSSCYYTPQSPIACACIRVRVFLEGFYDAQLQKMHTQLNDQNSLPLDQPYSIAPFNYTGTEQVAEWPEDTVDWVLIELRAANDLSNIVARQAALLRSDGQLMDTTGTQGISFDGVPDGTYHLAVFHRNHLAIVSAAPIPTNNPSFLYDFSTSEHQVLGDTQLKLAGQVWAMRSGDADHNHIINNQDYNLWKTQQGQSVSYGAYDLNADGLIDENDFQLWRGNRSKLGQLK